MAEALGIPAHRTGHFSRLRESLALEDCDILLVVGTPTLRPEDVVRLARADSHADPLVIDESERTRRGWALALPRCAAARAWPPRVSRAELTRVGTSQPAAALRRARGRDASRRRTSRTCR